MNARRKPSVWKLQDAKAQFSELCRRAQEQGPQHVTRHGKDAVVVLSAEEYDRLSNPGGEEETLSEFFRRSPFADSGVDLERVHEYTRDLDK
jgi:antitoxin Phd